MKVPYNAENIRAFYQSCSTWIKENKLDTRKTFFFDPSIPKQHKKKTEAPFSIIRLRNPTSGRIKYYVISNMEMGEGGFYGYIKVAYPITLKESRASVTHVYRKKGTIHFDAPVALKIIRHPDIESPETPFLSEQTIHHLNGLTKNQFFTAMVETSSTKEYPSLNKGSVNKKLYYVMPLYPQQDLCSWINTRAREKNLLSLKEFIIIIYALYQLLMNLHQKNLVHRDFKPDNILFSLSETTLDIHLVDFDHLAAPDQRLPVVGTRDYLAPELLPAHPDDRGNPKLFSFSQDIYAYGVTIKNIYHFIDWNKNIDDLPDIYKRILVNEQIILLFSGCCHVDPHLRFNVVHITKSFMALKLLFPIIHPQPSEPDMLEKSLLSFRITTYLSQIPEE